MLAAAPLVGAEPGRRLVAGVMGLGRGMAHVEALLGIPGVEIGYLCEVDEQRLKSGLARVAQRQDRPPRGVKDVREVLDDREVDLLTIAAPNHWHAPATILACAAGKHVYVEKPGSHNGLEAEMMVAAARKHRRLVQLGTQRRSWPGVMEMIERLHGGVIGRVHYARCWYSSARGSIGRGKPAAVPAHLDYALWQGPAPERPYLDNVVHYNWHWRWHWGGGELANNGVHALDIVTWGLKVEHPRRVVFNGGRYHFEDDQETPDTGAAVFDFGSCGATWDDSSCVPRGQEGLPFVAFYGEGGCVEQDGNGYKVYDEKGKATGSGNGPGGDRVHFENFIAAIRDGAALRAEIAEGQKAARLCHLGNVAYRRGGAVEVDLQTGRIQGDSKAARLWGREYRSGWKPRV
jgi:predicted dehydrogenase